MFSTAKRGLLRVSLIKSGERIAGAIFLGLVRISVKKQIAKNTFRQPFLPDEMFSWQKVSEAICRCSLELDSITMGQSGPLRELRASEACSNASKYISLVQVDGLRPKDHVARKMNGKKTMLDAGRDNN